MKKIEQTKGALVLLNRRPAPKNGTARLKEDKRPFKALVLGSSPSALTKVTPIVVGQMKQLTGFSRDSLIAEITATRHLLASLEAVLYAIDGQPQPEVLTASIAHSDLRVWKKVRNYLVEKHQEASMQELVAKLSSDGVALGKYPLRTVTAAVTSKKGKDLFAVEGKGSTAVIRLREPNIAVAAA